MACWCAGQFYDFYMKIKLVGGTVHGNQYDMDPRQIGILHP